VIHVTEIDCASSEVSGGDGASMSRSRADWGARMMDMNTSCTDEMRELTDDEIKFVSGGSLKDIANGLANALAPYAVRGWEIQSVDQSRLATRLPPYN
jgi:hypothetical protein